MSPIVNYPVLFIENGCRECSEPVYWWTLHARYGSWLNDSEAMEHFIICNYVIFIDGLNQAQVEALQDELEQNLILIGMIHINCYNDESNNAISLICQIVPTVSLLLSILCLYSIIMIVS